MRAETEQLGWIRRAAAPLASSESLGTAVAWSGARRPGRRRRACRPSPGWLSRPKSRCWTGRRRSLSTRMTEWSAWANAIARLAGSSGLPFVRSGARNQHGPHGLLAAGELHVGPQGPIGLGCGRPGGCVSVTRVGSVSVTGDLLSAGVSARRQRAAGQPASPAGAGRLYGGQHADHGETEQAPAPPRHLERCRASIPAALRRGDPPSRRG